MDRGGCFRRQKATSGFARGASSEALKQLDTSCCLRALSSIVAHVPGKASSLWLLRLLPRANC